MHGRKLSFFSTQTLVFLDFLVNLLLPFYLVASLGCVADSELFCLFRTCSVLDNLCIDFSSKDELSIQNPS